MEVFHMRDGFNLDAEQKPWEYEGMDQTWCKEPGVSSGIFRAWPTSAVQTPQAISDVLSSNLTMQCNITHL